MVDCLTASSYLQTANISVTAVAEMAVTRKAMKYRDLVAYYIYQPSAPKSLDPTDSNTHDILTDPGDRISQGSRNDQEISFLSQVLFHFAVSFRLTSIISVVLHDSFESDDFLEH